MRYTEKQIKQIILEEIKKELIKEGMFDPDQPLGKAFDTGMNALGRGLSSVERGVGRGIDYVSGIKPRSYIEKEQRIPEEAKSLLLKIKNGSDLAEIVNALKEGFALQDEGDERRANFSFEVAARFVEGLKEGGYHMGDKFSAPSGLSEEEKWSLASMLKNL